MNTKHRIFFIKSNLTCVFASLSFAAGFPALEILLTDWGVISVVLVRNTIAFIFILVVWLLIEGSKKLKYANWLKGFIIGALGFGLGSLLLVITQLLTSTFVAALAAALMPLAAISLEIIFDKRKMSVSFLFGLILVIFGSVILLEKTTIDLEYSVGLLLGLFSVTFFAWGSRASVKHLPNMTTLARTTTTTLGMCGFCLLIYLIFSFLRLGETHIPKINLSHTKLLIIYACIGLAISQILWISAVQKIGIGIASLHLNITPFYVMVILFFMGYEWLWIQAVGASIIVTGISLTQLNYKKIKQF